MVNTYPAAKTTLLPPGAPSIRHIVLPLDGGKLAEMAIDRAIALAHAFGADVILVRCFELDEHKAAGYEALILPANKSHMPLHMASLYLAHIEERIRGRGVEAQSRLYLWSGSSSTLPGLPSVQRYADALVVVAVQAGDVDVPRLYDVIADMSDGAQAPILFIPVGCRNPLTGGHLRGLRALAVNGDEEPAVAAYARILADALHGTTAYLSSKPSSTRHDKSSAMSDVTDVGRATGNVVYDIHRFLEHVGAGSEIVVMSANVQFGGMHANKDGCGFSEVLHAGAPLLVVP